MYKYLMGWSKKGGPRFFWVVPSDRPQGKRHKLKWRKFQFPHFTVSMVKHRNRLPGEVVESLSLEIFKIQHGPEQCAVADPALSRSVGLDDPQRSFPTSPMMGFCVSDSSLYYASLWSLEISENFFSTLFFSFSFLSRENQVINKQKAVHTMVYHLPRFGFCLSDSVLCQGLGQGTGDLMYHAVHTIKKCSHCSE